MATEEVLEVPIRRHVIDSERPFSSVLSDLFGGISQPDIGQVFSQLEASTSYEQFSSIVKQEQGSSGLMRFSSRRCPVAGSVLPTTRSPARSVPITTGPRWRSLSRSIPRCSVCCIG